LSPTPTGVIARYDGVVTMNGLRPVEVRPTSRSASPPLPARLGAPATVALSTDTITPGKPAETWLERPVPAGNRFGHTRLGRGIPLITTSARAAAIAAGTHQVRVVDGTALRYPSQNLAMIESSAPDRPGQTHALARHVGTTLADNVARLDGSPDLNAAGSYDSLADAQYATDETIANPANQRAIAAFLADPGRLRSALARVDLGRDVGSSTLRRELAAGRPALDPDATATVVLIKDATFPEGYRVLTTYPDHRPPELDPRGTPLP